ncbi:hypothetical protein Cfor_08705 [Coptotermes formosanus]|uniref:Uncharacterized protein n=1 Tax=Coptotermes formosanus TaxID=36987 RepID=A0A6L2PUW8_COPFO|nr:hypothetical protein Cfor_08705 [Coptotermes formosanus]
MLQCFTSLLVTGTTCGFLSLCATLLAVGCAQFEKLNATLLDIRQKCTKLRDRQEGAKDHTITNSNSQGKLNACIRHHQDITTYMQQLEDALNVGLCGHFLILLATMCFAAFSVVTVQYSKCCMLQH